MKNLILVAVASMLALSASASCLPTFTETDLEEAVVSHVVNQFGAEESSVQVRFLSETPFSTRNSRVHSAMVVIPDPSMPRTGRPSLVRDFVADEEIECLNAKNVNKSYTATFVSEGSTCSIPVDVKVRTNFRVSFKTKTNAAQLECR